MSGKMFCVVCYRKVEREPTEPLTWSEAKGTRDVLECKYPGNFYVIEEVSK